MTTAKEYMTKTAQEVRLKVYSESLQNLSQKLSVSNSSVEKIKTLEEILALLQNPPIELNFAKELKQISDFNTLYEIIKEDLNVIRSNKNSMTSGEVEKSVSELIQIVNDLYQEKKLHFNALSQSNFIWKGPTKDLGERIAAFREPKKIQLNENNIPFFQFVQDKQLAEGLKNGLPLPEGKTLILNCYNMVYLCAYLAGEMDYKTFKQTYEQTDIQRPNSPPPNETKWFAQHQKGMANMLKAEEGQKVCTDIKNLGQFISNLKANDIIAIDGNAHVLIATGNGDEAVSFWTTEYNNTGDVELGIAPLSAFWKGGLSGGVGEMRVVTPSWRPSLENQLQFAEARFNLAKKEHRLAKDNFEKMDADFIRKYGVNGPVVPVESLDMNMTDYERRVETLKDIAAFNSAIQNKIIAEEDINAAKKNYKDVVSQLAPGLVTKFIQTLTQRIEVLSKQQTAAESDLRFDEAEFTRASNAYLFLSNKTDISEAKVDAALQHMVSAETELSTSRKNYLNLSKTLAENSSILEHTLEAQAALKEAAIELQSPTVSEEELKAVHFDNSVLPFNRASMLDKMVDRTPLNPTNNPLQVVLASTVNRFGFFPQSTNASMGLQNRNDTTLASEQENEEKKTQQKLI